MNVESKSQINNKDKFMKRLKFSVGNEMINMKIQKKISFTHAISERDHGCDTFDDKHI